MAIPTTLANVQLHRVSQAADTLTFEAPGAYDGAIAWNESTVVTEGMSIALFNGAGWAFQGRVLTIEDAGAGAAESRAVTAAGPWWYLERCTFQQKWHMMLEVEDEETGVPAWEEVDEYTSRLILCQDDAGERRNTGEEIQAVLEYAIAKGVPLAIGTIDADVEAPWQEMGECSCADVIRQLLRWSPDCVTWFDYSTTPPTLHITRITAVAEEDAVAVPAAVLKGLALVPRTENLVDGVQIKYLQTHEEDGTKWDTIALDEAGVVTGWNVLVATLELAGSRTTHLTQRIEVETWPADLTSKTFWKARVAALEQVGEANFEIHDVEARTGSLASVLTQGTIQDWMLDEVSWERETVQALLDVTYNAGEEDEYTVSDVPVSVTVVSTNAESKTYRKLESQEDGEPQPDGLAASLFAALSTLYREGQFEVVQEEITGSYRPGQRLSVGGETLYSQETVEALDTGITRIMVGAPRHLGADELSELMRSLRGRKVAYRYRARTSGKSDDVPDLVPLAGPGPTFETAILPEPPPPGGGEEEGHNLLNGVTHPDTEADAAVNGALVMGSAATPALWQALAAGAGKSLLRMTDATPAMPAWWAGGYTGSIVVLAQMQIVAPNIELKYATLTVENGSVTAFAIDTEWTAVHVGYQCTTPPPP